MALFREHRLSYPGIAELIRAAMEEHRVLANPTVEEILETERQTYEFICRRF